MYSSWLPEIVERTQEIQAAGWIGWLVFIALYALASLIFAPGFILMFASGAIYGFWGGLVLALAGNALGALLSLLVTRYLLRNWAAGYFARHRVMGALESAVKKDGWKIVSLTHLSPIMPFSVVNYAFGLTRIPVAEFVLATVLGALPSTVVYVYLGSLVCGLAQFGPEVEQHRLLEWLLQAIGLLATIAVTIWITRAASAALKKRLPREE